MDIKKNKTSHSKLTAFNGQREVRLKSDALRRQQIPYLINYQFGQIILIIVPCQDPFCLRCSELGHITGHCLDRFRAFSSAVTRVSTKKK